MKIPVDGGARFVFPTSTHILTISFHYVRHLTVYIASSILSPAFGIYLEGRKYIVIEPRRWRRSKDAVFISILRNEWCSIHKGQMNKLSDKRSLSDMQLPFAEQGTISYKSYYWHVLISNIYCTRPCAGSCYVCVHTHMYKIYDIWVHISQTCLYYCCICLIDLQIITLR